MQHVVAIIQARMGSSRLPGKSLMPLGAFQTVLSYMISRLEDAQTIDRVIVATTSLKEDDLIESACEAMGISCFRGSDSDVLSRYFLAAQAFKATHVVRLTGDCPLQDYQVVDDLVSSFFEAEVDYAANAIEPTYPDGFDAEVMTFSALEKAYEGATLKSQKEHVTPFIHQHPELFSIKNVSYKDDVSHLRLTLDTQEDYQLLLAVSDWMDTQDHYVHLDEIVAFVQQNPQLSEMNSKYKRNEGYEKSLLQD